MSIRTSLSVVFLLLALALPVSAATITYDIQAYIDGQSQLIISGNTARWHNLGWTVPGKHSGHNDPTIFTSTLNATVVMNNVQWFPNWPGDLDGDQWSDTFNGINPVFPGSSIVGVGLTPILARGSLTIFQMPEAGNGYELILDFNDPEGGSTWYRGLVTVTTTDTQPIPEPATWALSAAVLALAALRRRR